MKIRIKVMLFIIVSFLTVAVSSGQKNNKKIFITGIVTDANQRPMIGAMILIDGKSTSVITDNSGIYKIKVRPDADSMTIFTIKNGMITVPIMGRTKIDFILGGADPSKHDAKDKPVNDNQVDIGYGSISEKSLLTPVSTIDGRNGKYAAYKDIYEILKGTPGVIVRGTSIQIQGPSSIYSGTEPLFVIDGMPVQTIDGISPSMVESISVLKGASASIYGTRGANGVILITLIKASQKK
jgi:TonB-dependent starch-binding outer membrane protein SusC